MTFRRRPRTAPLPPLAPADATIKEMDRQLLRVKSLVYVLDQSNDRARRMLTAV